MKTVIEDDKIIVYLNKNQIKDLQLNNDDKLESYFKKMFLDLNKKYDIELNGYYEVELFKDNNYGIVLEIKNEDLDYYNYFSQIDMKIIVSDISMFLYEIKYEFLNTEFIKNAICYKCLDKLYLKLKDNIDNNIFNKLLEFSNLIYGDKVEEILKYSKKVNI